MFVQGLSCVGNNYLVYLSKLDLYFDFEFFDFKFNFIIIKCFFCYKLFYEIFVIIEGRIEIGKELFFLLGGYFF